MIAAAQVEAQTPGSAPTSLLQPELQGGLIFPPQAPGRRTDIAMAPTDAGASGTPPDATLPRMSDTDPRDPPRIRRADLGTPPDVTLPRLQDGESRDHVRARQSGNAKSPTVPRLPPRLLRPTLDSDPQNPPQFHPVDVALAVTNATRFSTRTVDGFFGAPGAGIIVRTLPTRCKPDGTGRTTAGDSASGCLTELAFNPSPPPATRDIIPRNLPQIPPKDARPIPPTAADTPAEKPAGAMMEEDPYEPKGVTAGNFLFKPALEVSTGYDSNPERVPNGRGSPVVVVAPELLVRSQFDRHALNADLRASYTDVTAVQAFSHPTVDAKVNGRYDVTNTTAINGEARYNLDADDPNTGRIAGRFAQIPLISTPGATVGVTQKFDPVEVSVKASVDRVLFQNARLTDGMTVSNQDRDLTQYGIQTRVAYALTPQLSPFVDVAVDRRTHDLAVDMNGFRRDSTGTAVEVGTTFGFTDKLTGDAAVGYVTRKYDDPRLPNLGGFIADANLTYQVTRDTSVQFGAKSQVTEFTDAFTSGVFKRDTTIEVDHQLNPQLTGALKAGYGQDRFIGQLEVDNRYFVGVGMVYKVNRMLQLKGDFRQEWLRSNVPVNDLMATVLMLGARVQY